MAPTAAQLLTALSNPYRRRILRALLDSGKASPSVLSEELDLKLSTASYHVSILLKNRVIKKAGSRPARGATEHFYKVSFGDHDELARQALAASEQDDD